MRIMSGFCCRLGTGTDISAATETNISVQSSLGVWRSDFGGQLTLKYSPPLRQGLSYLMVLLPAVLKQLPSVLERLSKTSAFPNSAMVLFPGEGEPIWTHKLERLVRLALGALEDRDPHPRPTLGRQRTVPEGMVIWTGTGRRRLGSPPNSSSESAISSPESVISSPESAIPPSGTGTTTWSPNGGIGRVWKNWAPWIWAPWAAIADGLVGRTVK